MKRWLCNINLACRVSSPNHLDQAKQAFEQKWPKAQHQVGWDAVVIDAADEQGLVGEINQRFANCLKRIVPEADMAGATFDNTIPWPPVIWRVGTQFHSSGGTVTYKPMGATESKAWQVRYANTLTMDIELEVSFRELITKF